ncbi:MAG: T9SS type A sorting domain-containing protein [Bacteroidota bacterium]
MNKYLLTIATLIMMTFSFYRTQGQIPNAGFESWTTHTGFGTYLTPDSWGTLNQLTGLAGQFTATRVTPGNSGTYAIRLQAIPGIPFIGSVPGILSSGQINTQTFGSAGGFPINFRPLMFKGYYKYDLTAGLDTATIAIVMTMWNTVTNSRDTVGLGGTQFRTDQQTWTSFSAFIIPTSASIPDTISILILSGSLTSANPGALFLDDLSYYPNPAGISEVNNEFNHFSVYPNPASTNMNVKYDDFNTNPASLTIYDVTGRELDRMLLTQQNSTINTTKYPNGIYFYQLSDKNNQGLLNGKFSIINN